MDYKFPVSLKGAKFGEQRNRQILARAGRFCWSTVDKTSTNKFKIFALH